MKKTLLIIGVCTITIKVYAQPGVSEMNQAANNISGSFFSMQDFSFVLAALVGIFGASRIYYKWQMGKDVTLDITAWFFACLFIVLMNYFLTALFGM
ncbi:DUF4134 domain-containing protein [Pedobacter polaris]|uniref:DUF4134 domain-containing protein n=1 Tax=Pedobacter polaris TaxID=2571273 RepID=A0A4V5NZM0_9SPHI|nr:DUF4134 family protein [Pedobacter polaris]TKC08015.1 DUF4134 domain-containing protein [Pedobacter polaris]